MRHSCTSTEFSTRNGVLTLIKHGDSFHCASLVSQVAGQLSRYSHSLRAGRSGYRIPVGARFSAPVQTGPGVYPVSYTMGTSSLPGVKRPGRGVDHPPHPAPRLKKEQSYTITPRMSLRGLFQGELPTLSSPSRSPFPIFLHRSPLPLPTQGRKTSGSYTSQSRVWCHISPLTISDQ